MSFERHTGWYLYKDTKFLAEVKMRQSALPFACGASAFRVIARRNDEVISLGQSMRCMAYTRSWPREGQSLCSHKVTKRLSAEMLLALLAFALQIRQNHGLLNFAATLFAHGPRFRQNCYCPANRTGQHCSARFRPKLIC